MPNLLKRTHCIKRGHLLTPDNIYTLVRPNGTTRRTCKRCKLDGDAARYQERKRSKVPCKRGRPRKYARAHTSAPVESNPFQSDYEFGLAIRRKKDAERAVERKQLMDAKREQWKALSDRLGETKFNTFWVPKIA